MIWRAEIRLNGSHIIATYGKA